MYKRQLIGDSDAFRYDLLGVAPLAVSVFRNIRVKGGYNGVVQEARGQSDISFAAVFSHVGVADDGAAHSGHIAPCLLYTSSKNFRP